jgi:hypothetical protein
LVLFLHCQGTLILFWCGPETLVLCGPWKMFFIWPMNNGFYMVHEQWFLYRPVNIGFMWPMSTSFMWPMSTSFIIKEQYYYCCSTFQSQ